MTKPSKIHRLALGTGVAMLAATVLPLSANAQDMAGKTITLIHNASPGGATGVGAEVAAQAWAKAIPGNPEMIVQAVPGGALTKGINAVKNARPDGTTLGWVAWQGSTRILDPEELQFDWNEFGIIGGVGGASFFVVLNSELGDSIEAIADSGETVTFGGFNTKSSSSMQTAAAFDLLGVKWKFASGFAGGGPLLAAMGRGEIDGYPVTAVNYQTEFKEGGLKDGTAIGPWHYGFLDDSGEHMVPDPAYGTQVPVFDQFYKESTGEEPSGDAWEMIKFHAAVSSPVNWLVMAPPGTSEEDLKMFRESFAEAMTSPEYIEEATRVYGAPPNVELTDDMLSIVEQVTTTSEEMKDILRSYIDRMEQ